MTATQLAETGFIASLLAAALLAAAPGFDPARRGWLPRFGWILLRYVLPLALMIAVISWLLMRR